MFTVRRGAGQTISLGFSLLNGVGQGQGNREPRASTADVSPTLLPLPFNSGLKQYPSIDIMKDCKWLTLTVALNWILALNVGPGGEFWHWIA